MTLRHLLLRAKNVSAAAGLALLLLGCTALPPDPSWGPIAPAATSPGCLGTQWRDASSGISIGAIRWDAWFSGSQYERFLGPAEWHYRLPFYGNVLSPNRVSVRADSPGVMNKEIGFAAAAGLTCWAFDYYHPRGFAGASRFNEGLRQYLSSPCRGEINFSLVLQGRWLGPPVEWSATVSTGDVPIVVEL